MKLGTTLVLFGYVALALPACGSDLPSSQSPNSSAGTTSSAGSMSAAGSVNVAGSANVAGGAGGTNSAGSAGAPNSAGSAGVPSSGGAGGSSGGAAASGGSGGLPPLQECSTPSLDRITQWTATSGECTCTPVGNILTKDGQSEVAKVTFTGTDWHVVPVLITNQFGKTADVSAAPGITLTYSATAALHVQVRSGSHWNGGDQWAADIPATSGMKQTFNIPFDASKWMSLFGAPTETFTDVLKEVQGLVFVGNSANSVVFYGLRIQGFEPACP